MKPRLFGIALALSLAWMTMASAHAAPGQDTPEQGDRPRVAVIPVAAINASWDEAGILAQRLRASLAHVLDVEVLSAEAMQAGLAGKPVPEGCMSQADCIRALGIKIEVDEILFLAIVRIGDRIQIDVTWGDARTGRSETRDPVRVDNPSEQREVLERVAQRLLPGAAPRSRASSGTPAATEPTGASPGSTAGHASPSPTGGLMDQPQDIGGSGRRMTTGVWIAGGIAVAALAGGSVFGVRALDTESELEACVSARSCVVDQGRVDDLARQRDIADIMFASAIGAGVIAGVLYWRSATTGTRINVAVTPSRTAVTWSMRF